MTVDWGNAIKVGGVGFGTVFVVLILLALAMWLTGLIIRKMDAGKEDAGDNKKGA